MMTASSAPPEGGAEQRVASGGALTSDAEIAEQAGAVYGAGTVCERCDAPSGGTPDAAAMEQCGQQDELLQQCERNPLCVRGYKHKGLGGHCSTGMKLSPGGHARPPGARRPPAPTTPARVSAPDAAPGSWKCSHCGECFKTMQHLGGHSRKCAVRNAGKAMEHVAASETGELQQEQEQSEQSEHLSVRRPRRKRHSAQPYGRSASDAEGEEGADGAEGYSLMHRRRRKRRQDEEFEFYGSDDDFEGVHEPPQFEDNCVSLHTASWWPWDDRLPDKAEVRSIRGMQKIAGHAAHARPHEEVRVYSFGFWCSGPPS